MQSDIMNNPKDKSIINIYYIVSIGSSAAATVTVTGATVAVK